MSIRKALAIVTVFLLLISSILTGSSLARQETETNHANSLAGLQDTVQVIRDGFGGAHIFARNDHDVYFMMGFVHAQDRFFQMDFNRRQASGTLAELLGNQVLASDVQLRTIGLRRAALRSRAAYSPEAIAVLQAYADGVNASLDTNPLPPEYAALELTRAGIPPWTIDDSIAVAKLLAFGLSFDDADLNNTTALRAYQTAGQAAGFDGTMLFFEDLSRSAPFDPIVSIPQQQSPGALAAARRQSQRVKESARAQELIKPHTVESIHEFLKGTAHNPLFSGRKSDFGSNWYVISGAKTATGFPMLANDPHLSLISPLTFYEIHLVVNGPSPLNVYGVSFPGAPSLPQEFNERIAWGSVVNPLDVTDFYQERLINDSFGDITLLRSLKDALNLLAGPGFAPAFGGSTDQDDCRWGRLHRIVFRHPLSSPFNIPPGAGFTNLSPLLPGIATDGGFDVVDASNHNPRAATLNAFMFGSGPSRRFIGEARRSRIRAVEIMESGVPGSPFFGNMLGSSATCSGSG